MAFYTAQSEFNQSAASRCVSVCVLLKETFVSLKEKDALPKDKTDPALTSLHTQMTTNLDTIYNHPDVIRGMTSEHLVRLRYDLELLSDNFIQFAFKNPMPKDVIKQFENFWKLAIRGSPYTSDDFKKAEKLIAAVVHIRACETLPSWETTERWDAFKAAEKNFSDVFPASEKNKKIRAYTGYSSTNLSKRKAMLWGHDFIRTVCLGRSLK